MTESYWAGRSLYGDVYSCVSFASEAERDQWIADAPVYGSRLALDATDAAVVAFLADHAAFTARLLDASGSSAEEMAEYEDSRMDWDAYFAAKAVQS